MTLEGYVTRLVKQNVEQKKEQFLTQGVTITPSIEKKLEEEQWLELSKALDKLKLIYN